MKKTIVILILLFCLTNQLCHSKEFVFTGPYDHLVKIAFIVLTEAYGELSIDLRLMQLPAERSLYDSNAGIVDGEVNRIAGLEDIYENLVMVNVPVNFIESCCFTNISTIESGGWEVFNNYKTGIKIGIKITEKNVIAKEIIRANDYDQLFLMLKNGRIDMVAASLLEGMEAFEKYSKSGIYFFKLDEPPKNLYHYLHKKHSPLIYELEKVLREMEESGRIKEIRENYISTHFEQE